jgi:hypothetical protein
LSNGYKCPVEGQTGANQYSTETLARAHCPTGTVVWANTRSNVYHFRGTYNYGNTKAGAYMCEQDSLAEGMRAAKNEKHPWYLFAVEGTADQTEFNSPFESAALFRPRGGGLKLGTREGNAMSGLEPVLIAAAIVFVLNAVGSFIEFNNRFVNALVDTVLFAVVFGALMHFGYLHMSFSSAAPAVAP